MELIILVKILALIFLTLNIQESTIDLLDYQISKFDMCWNPLMQDFSYYIVKNNITEVEAQVYLDLSDNINTCLDVVGNTKVSTKKQNI